MGWPTLPEPKYGLGSKNRSPKKPGQFGPTRLAHGPDGLGSIWPNGSRAAQLARPFEKKFRINYLITIIIKVIVN